MALETPQSEIEKQYGDFRAPSSIETHQRIEMPWAPTDEHEPFKSIEPTDPILDSHEATKEALIQQMVQFREVVKNYVSSEMLANNGDNQAKSAISKYGSMINKQFTEAMKIADVVNDRQLTEVVFATLSRELEAILELPAAGQLYDNRRAGAVAEWAVAKTLNDGCYVDVYGSTIDEDRLPDLGKVDLWATPGNSEYSGFAENPNLTWAIQVKTNKDIEDVHVLPIDDAERLHAVIERLNCSPGAKATFIESADMLSRAEDRFTDVTPVLILVPDFSMAIGYIDNKTGMPKAPFEAAMDEALSEISDSKLAA